MTTRKTLLTAEDLAAMPDDGCHRYELVRGDLRESMPSNERHGEISSQIAYLLMTWAWRTRTGRVIGESGYILERSPDTVRSSDVAFISRLRQRPAGRVRGIREATPDLIVEVISPDDTVREIAEKTAEWLAAGAQLVWNVYPNREAVEAFWGDGRKLTYTAADTIDAEPVAELFALPDEE